MLHSVSEWARLKTPVFKKSSVRHCDLLSGMWEGFSTLKSPCCHQVSVHTHKVKISFCASSALVANSVYRIVLNNCLANTAIVQVLVPSSGVWQHQHYVAKSCTQTRPQIQAALMQLISQKKCDNFLLPVVEGLVLFFMCIFCGLVDLVSWEGAVAVSLESAWLSPLL